jgi:hypothetical protein
VKSRTEHLRFVAIAGLVLLVLVAAMIARRVEGDRALAASQAALARSDVGEAVVQARVAAAAHCAICPASELGYARLYAIAKEAEARADDRTAVAAWRAVRASTLATTVLDRETSRRLRADQEIARLEHRIDVASAAAGAAPSPAASEERLRAALAQEDTPPPALHVVLAIAAMLFLAGAVRAVRKSSAQNIALAAGGIALATAAALLL